MSMRIVKSARRTDETEISLTLNLDGSGIYDVDTGCGFLNHMLELFSRHGRFDLTLACRGDVQVDYHHTVEDIAIVLGRAFSEALGDRAGINRYGTCTLPMDEALILAAVDISGRPAVGYALEVPTEKVGDFDTELVEEFLTAEACAGDACTACCGAPARPVILACGPRPMLKGVAALAERYGVPCQVSLEERMGCGVGACLVCACKTADGRMKHVCKDGPVFDSREVDWND